MKKTIMVLAMLSTIPAFALSHPKLDVLEIQPQTTVTIPQYCDQFGKMFIDIVLLGLNPEYTKQDGVNFINNYIESYADTSKLNIPPVYNQFSVGVLPTVPTMTTFKERFKGKDELTDHEMLWIYDLGFDTCLKSLEKMMLEEK